MVAGGRSTEAYDFLSPSRADSGSWLFPRASSASTGAVTTGDVSKRGAVATSADPIGYASTTTSAREEDWPTAVRPLPMAAGRKVLREPGS